VAKLPAFDPVTGKMDWAVVLFIFSFIIVVVWGLVQVIVAVLLDNFISATMNEKTELALERQRKRKIASHALDPLLERISDTYANSSDLSKKIETLYRVLEKEDKQALDFQSIRTGLGQLDLKPTLHFAKEDFDALTEDGEYCDSKGELSLEDFQLVMRRELFDYTQRQLADALAMQHSRPDVLALLASSKMMLMQREANDFSMKKKRQRYFGEDEITLSLPTGSDHNQEGHQIHNQIASQQQLNRLEGRMDELAKGHQEVNQKIDALSRGVQSMHMLLIGMTIPRPPESGRDGAHHYFAATADDYTRSPPDTMDICTEGDGSSHDLGYEDTKPDASTSINGASSTLSWVQQQVIRAGVPPPTEFSTRGNPHWHDSKLGY